MILQLIKINKVVYLSLKGKEHYLINTIILVGKNKDKNKKLSRLVLL